MRWDVFLGITSSVGLFHAFFLMGYLYLTPKGDRTANVLLALMLLAFGIRIFKSTYFALFASMLWFLPALGLICMSVNGPLLLVYARHLRGEPFVLKRNFVHILLPVATLMNLFIDNDLLLRTFYLVVIISQFGYIIYVTTLLVGTRDESDAHRWLTKLTVAFAIIEIVYLLQWTRLDDFSYIVATCFSSMVIAALTYTGLLNHDLFRKIHRPSLAISDNDDHELRARIRFKIIDEQGFRDSNLSLKTLAGSFNLPSSRVSAALHREFNKTFPEVVNELRLRYVTGRLRGDDAHEKVESLAFDAGFQSASSFYAHFKKAYKMTPSEYRSVNRIRSASQTAL